MNAYMKEGRIVTFIFASEVFGADKLLSYTNNKIMKNQGKDTYMLFLYELNITHEECTGYIENVYKANKS